MTDLPNVHSFAGYMIVEEKKFSFVIHAQRNKGFIH